MDVELLWAFGDLTGFQTNPGNPAHFHHLENGYETSHGWQGDFQGLYIERLDGSPFDLLSIDYQLAETLNATSLLVSTTFDPTQPIVPQFTAYDVSG